MKKQTISLYLRDLAKHLSATKVTSKKNALSLESGIKKAVDRLVSLRKNSTKVMLIGNGGSAAIASHQAMDLWRSGGIRSMAFNDAVGLTCLGNDFGYEYVFSKGIQMFADKGDLLLAVSSSGRSKNILNAVSEARQRKCAVITFSGFGADNPLRASGDLNFYVGSQSYGFEEVAHLALIHAISDFVGMQTKARL